jgi:DNA repair exonuclease SbcCD ATPase subunit
MPTLTDLRIRGIGCFTEEIHVDLTKLEGPLVALVGENGEGKTMFCESWPAAMYRKFPARGKLKEVATARDAFIEALIVNNGHTYRIRQTIDAQSGDGESLVVDPAHPKVPLTKSGKVSEYDVWAKRHLPSPEVLYCSIFGVQGSLGFLDLDPAPRKGVLLRVLGHEHLEKKASCAGRHADKLDTDLQKFAARLGDERKRSGDFDALVNRLQELQGALPAAEAALAAARTAKEGASAQLARAELQEKAAQQAALRRSALEQKIAELQKAIADIEERLASNRKVLGNAEKIRAAEARMPVAAAEQAEARAALQTIDETIRALELEKKQLIDARLKAVAAFDGWRKTIAEQEKRLSMRAAVEAATAALPALEAAFLARKQTADADAHALEELKRAALHGAGGRITSLRTAHETIAAGADAPRAISREAIEADDVHKKAGDEAPERIAELTRKLTGERQELDRIAREIAAIERTAARKEELDAIDEALVTMRTAAAGVEADVARLDVAIADVPAPPSRADGKAKLDALSEEIARLAKLAPLATPLSNAETRLAELAPQLEERRARVATARAELLAIEPVELPVRPDVTAIDRRLAASEAADRKLRADIAAANAGLEASEVSRARADELAEEVRRAEEEMTDWRLLQQDLGRDGVQALEIDGVGPELTEIANELLRTCYGTRFMVEITTTRPRAVGEGDTEGCWVLVTDNLKQRTSEAKTFSGGERVMISEAINLAILALVCKRTGDREPTIVRDETAAALSAGNAPRYIAMLRRAAAMIGASKVLYVSHDPESQALADSRLVFSSGMIRAA